MLRRTVPIGLTFFLGVVSLAGAAPPKGPPPPAEYDALVRFHVEGFRNQRFLLFTAMKRYLEDAGFKEDPDDPVQHDDPRATALRGQIASGKARRMLGERHVQTIRLAPLTFKPVKDKPQTVRVELELHGGLPGERQRQLREQVLRVVGRLGFIEAYGYDDRGLIRLLGSVPDGNVDSLARDLRRDPAGWDLLSKDLLNDVRSNPNTLPLFRQILDDWYDHTEGKKLLQRILGVWAARPQGQRLLNSLPADVVNSKEKIDRVTVEVHLLSHLSTHPEAGDLFRQLLGDVMDSKVNRELMDVLLKRLNSQLESINFPLFYRMVSPIRVVEVMPTAPAPSPRLAPPPIPPGQEKITPDLREVLADAGEAAKRRRLELILALPPAENDRGWRKMLLETAGDAVVEGQMGNLVTVYAAADAALKFAAAPEIAVVRLPRPARPQMQLDPAGAGENFEPLRKTGERQVILGHNVRGLRAAVIDGDFRGWESLKGKQLPEKTRLVDLTRERNRNLMADPEVGPENELGHGTRYAIAFARATQTTDLTLIRIDPGAPHQLAVVARLINGEPLQSLNLDQRLRDLEEDGIRLRLRKEQLLNERREILEDFGIDEETVKRRKALFKRQEDLARDQKEAHALTQRYFQLVKELRDLKGIGVVASSLVWAEGYPVEGGSTLSRYFDDRPFKAATWFQAAGNTVGQAWRGFFRDSDNNGVMEFAPPTSPLPEGAWSRELNWLGWEPLEGRNDKSAIVRDLPANAKLRFTVQWREAHDPSFLMSGDDAFRQPLAEFRVVLMQQLDPKGEKRPADDLEVVAESVGLPQRLDKTAGAGVYEQILQVRLPRAGRYLVRIEGKVPDSNRPTDAPTLPSARKVGEIYPRLYVETLEGQGRAVWHTYVSSGPALGMPADSLRVVTVGAGQKAK